MTSDFVRFVDIGVDWITVTIADPIHQVGAELRCRSILRSQEKSGAKLRPWSMSGFEGLACGQAQYGWQNHVLLVRLTSATAHAEWRHFARWATNCSRLDVQVTVEYASDPSRVTRAHLRQMKRWRLGRGRPPTLSLYHDADGPSTVYLGKRISDRFGRIYNKAAESQLDHYKNCVRYEVELKNDTAWIALCALRDASDETAWVLSHVCTFFKDRGASLRWPPDVRATISCPRTRSNAARRLQWLAESVKGPVQELIEGGMLAEALTALGIDHAVLDQWAREQHSKTELEEVR